MQWWVRSEEDAANLYIIKTFEQAFQLALAGHFSLLACK